MDNNFRLVKGTSLYVGLTDTTASLVSLSALFLTYCPFVSKQGLDLRVEHTHGFSHHGEGGHYYIDTTPSTVEYLGYFLPAEFVYRIDRPVETHNVGRD